MNASASIWSWGICMSSLWLLHRLRLFRLWSQAAWRGRKTWLLNRTLWRLRAPKRMKVETISSYINTAYTVSTPFFGGRNTPVASRSDGIWLHRHYMNHWNTPNDLWYAHIVTFLTRMIRINLDKSKLPLTPITSYTTPTCPLVPMSRLILCSIEPTLRFRICVVAVRR